MQLNELVTKIQSRLLLNDQLIKQLEEEREDVVSWQKEEQRKVEKHFQDVLRRIGAARDGFLSQLDKEATNRLQSLDLREQCINSACLVLSPELITIQQVMMDEFRKDKYDMSGCWDRVQSLLSDQTEKEDDSNLPTFFPSPTISKVKKADFGFLQLAEFLPQDFLLALTSSPSSLKLGSLATCSVVTPGQFTSSVQANIQFSIKLQGSKTTVPFCREECRVSDDQKSFQIKFPVSNPGVYLVTVLLYGQHVQHSPVSVHVLNTHQETENMDRSSTDTTPTLPLASTASLRQPKPSTVTTPAVHSTSTNVSTSSKQAVSRPPNIVSRLIKQGTDFTRLVGVGCVVENVTMKIPAATERKCGKSTLTMPIGMCLLQNKTVVVASTFEDKVKIFSNTGNFIKQVVPGSPFNHPSDMITLRSGDFVVRDDASIQFFNSEGKYIRSLDSSQINKCYGLAENEMGQLVTINENKGTSWRRGKKEGEMKITVEGGTAVGDTDLLFFSVESGQLVKRMELTDIIKDKQRSKCRFLTSWQGKLLITDLGLDCVYTLDPVTRGVAVCGKSGTGPGCFSNPAGVVVDSLGNWLVADSMNHRLCVYTGQGEWMGEVRLRPGARRPSGLAMDKESGDVYILNLQGQWALVRYSLNRRV
eukprot:GFUD01020362.1.p1 GENE.GFUD01020362.1~~GFUD01020362.1.p1  ORF type:complete len:646 (-),score=219.15 GFUD01020362.1:60-1997(-)